jgi:hypothetical protein
VRCNLDHSPGVARWANATGFAGKCDQEIVAAFVAAVTGEAEDQCAPTSILPRKRERKQTRKALFNSCLIAESGEMLVLHAQVVIHRIEPSRVPAMFRDMPVLCDTTQFFRDGGADNIFVRHI